MSDRLGAVLGALADPTRREMVEVLLADGVTSVPSLTGRFPITRQAVAKHLAALDDAGLVERIGGAGREVRYRLRPGALAPAADWVRAAESAWDGRLGRLKRAVEDGPSAPSRKFVVLPAPKIPRAEEEGDSHGGGHGDE